MKLMICGSMTFSKEMLETKKRLESLGHQVQIPTDAQDIVDGKHDNDDLEADFAHCVEKDIMRSHFKFIENSDAVLVLNHGKNGIKWYIGTATLMELGVAHHLHKKIFLMNPLPHHSEHRWVHEVRIMQPVVINGDFSRIN